MLREIRPQPKQSAAVPRNFGGQLRFAHGEVLLPPEVANTNWHRNTEFLPVHSHFAGPFTTVEEAHGFGRVFHVLHHGERLAAQVSREEDSTDGPRHSTCRRQSQVQEAR